METIDLLDNGKVIKKILKEGDGDYPKIGNEVAVHYTGRLVSGEQFDSSKDRGKPFSFTLGAQQVIKGWDVGVASMKVGEHCILTLNHEFGYGQRGYPPKIPPEATLEFEIELLSVSPKRHDPATMSAAERLQAANEAKAEGNRWFSEKKFVAAADQYRQSVDMLNNLEDWPEELQKPAHELRIVSNLNLATTYTNLGSYQESVLASTAVIQEEPDNVKGLYRRGVARLKMNNGTEAKQDLLAAAKLSPKDSAIRQALDEARLLSEKEKTSERITYSKMFE